MKVSKNHPIRTVHRWSSEEIEGRIKSVFWSEALVEARSVEEIWLSYSVLKSKVAGDRDLSDRTFASVLRSMLATGKLERAQHDGRPKYRMQPVLTTTDERQIALATDNQRLTVGAQLGVTGDLSEGWTLYAIPAGAPRGLLKEMEGICLEARDAIIELVTEESISLRKEVVRELNGRMSKKSLADFDRFLGWSVMMRASLGNPPLDAAYYTLLEKLLGPEFAHEFAVRLPEVMVELARRHEKSIVRAYAPAVKVHNNADPVVRYLGLLFAAPDSIAEVEQERLRDIFRRSGISVRRVTDLGKHWITLLQCMTPTAVISAFVPPRLRSKEIEEAFRMAPRVEEWRRRTRDAQVTPGQ